MGENFNEYSGINHMCQQYINKYHTLVGFPKRYITFEMCQHYFSEYHTLEGIPEQYITFEMCQQYFNKYHTLERIPEKYITFEMCQQYFNEYYTLEGIPEQYITSEMCQRYFNKKHNLHRIPEKYITSDMCQQYFNKKYNLRGIPEKYITPEMCKKYFNTLKRSFVDIFKLKFCLIPEKYRTEEMCQYYFSRTSDLKEIPEKYRTEEMCQYYFSRTYDLKEIPEQYITFEMCQQYFNEYHTLDAIPDRFKDRIFEITHDLNLVSEERRTREMCEEYFNILKQTDDIYEFESNFRLIPEKYRTEEMYQYYFSRTYDLKKIPEQYITFEMCQQYFAEKHTLDAIPDKFKDQVCATYYLDSGKLKYIPSQYINDILQNILVLLNTITFTKEYLLANLNLSETQFNNILNYAQNENPELYKKIKDILDRNSKNYVAITKNRINFLNVIVSNMDLGKELTKEQKIYFTYQFYSAKPARSLETIWTWLMRNPKDNKELIMFFRNYLKFKTANDMSDYEVLSPKEQKQEQLPSWIKNYDLRSKMGNEGREVTLHFMKGEDVVTVSKEEVKLVLAILNKNEIPTKNCIVNEAIRQYAIGDLNEFIVDLQESLIVNTKSNLKK